MRQESYFESGEKKRIMLFISEKLVQKGLLSSAEKGYMEWILDEDEKKGEKGKENVFGESGNL